MTDSEMTTERTPSLGMRVVSDSFGDMEVPEDVLWQASTQRAVENFPISGVTIHRALLTALIHIKASAATANLGLGVINQDQFNAIESACEQLLANPLEPHFPVDQYQTGSGTSTNMNANEVIATLAQQLSGGAVHPNDHVNASQSSNDVFPTAMRVAAVATMQRNLVPSLEILLASLEAKAKEFAGVVKSGRTHLMDAVPMTLGQEFSGYAMSIRLALERFEGILPRVCELTLGGTAVGTGLNAPPGFAERAIATIAARYDLPFTVSRNRFEAQATQDGLVELNGLLRVLAVSLNKIASDIRWMSSGPATGLSEIRIPELQPGSSIMPGKVNPVIPEVVHQVAARVIGNDAAVGFAGASGNFELNVMLPLIGQSTLESLLLLANTAEVFARKCIDGIQPNEQICLTYAESSPSIVTSLVPLIGYRDAAEVAHIALAEQRTIREVLLERHDLDENDVAHALDVLAMAHGGVVTSSDADDESESNDAR